MADSEYLKMLYNDFNNKQDSITRYLETIKEESDALYESVYDTILLTKKKYNILKKTQASMPKVVPPTSFAVERKPSRDKGNEATTTEVEDTLLDINLGIQENYQEINYRFTKQEKNLNLLNAAHVEIQGLINNVFETWNLLLAEIEQPKT
jgi:hypothetical protein